LGLHLQSLTMIGLDISKRYI